MTVRVTNGSEMSDDHGSDLGVTGDVGGDDGLVAN